MKKQRGKTIEECILTHDAGNDARLRRILGELKKGFAFLETFACDQVVTIFGSARVSEKSVYYKKARELGYQLGKLGMTVITGGGPGIMEAANRGASEAGGRSVGINIFLPHGERRNSYVKESTGFYYFFNRKLILAYSAEAYVFFPGGYGTLDELFEILNLVITKKIAGKIPIVLVGKTYWTPLKKWMLAALKGKLESLTQKELNIFTITDSVEEVVKKVKQCPVSIPRAGF